MTDLSVMASRIVTDVTITYVGQKIHRKVPPNGVLTVPSVLGEAADTAVFDAFNATGRQVGRVEYCPVERPSDHPSAW